MKTDRKIVIAVNHVKMEDEDQLDVEYWLTQPPLARLAEVCRLRKNYFTWLNGSFPQKLKKLFIKEECNPGHQCNYV